MITWKDFYIESEIRNCQIAQAKHYRLVRACKPQDRSSAQNSQLKFSPCEVFISTDFENRNESCI